jgi:HPt (histidine-containing phosphotransfer) domain-containing protein
MISAAATIGAKQLSAAALALEQELASGDASNGGVPVDPFEQNLRVVIDGLVAYFKTGD